MVERVTRNHPALTLFLIGWVTAILISPGDMGIDTRRRLQVSRWMWTSEPQVASSEPVEFQVKGRGGASYYFSGIGQSLVMLPAEVLSTVVTGEMRPGKVRERVYTGIVSLLVFPVITGLILVAAFRTLLGLGFNCSDGFLGSLGLLFLTGLLQASQSLQEDSLMLLLCLYAYGEVAAHRNDGIDRRIIVAGFALGFVVLIRLPALVFALPAFCLLLWDNRRGEGGQRIVLFRLMKLAMGVVLGVVLDRLYHLYRFETIWGTYKAIYGQHRVRLDPTLGEGWPFNGHFQEGFLGPLIDVEKSIFLFDPILFLIVIGFVMGWWRLKSRTGIAICSLTCVLVITLLGYANFVMWGGDSAWGARFESVPVQVLCLLAMASAFTGLRHCSTTAMQVARTIGFLIMVFSMGIQFSSVAIDYNVECAQRIERQEAVVVVLERFRNIAAKLSGRAEAADYPSARLTSSILLNKPWRPLAFRASEYLPEWAGLFFRWAWLCSVVSLIAGMIASIREWSNRDARTRYF